MTHVAPIHTPSLYLREFVPDDVPQLFQMSLESGIRTWLPDQVYTDEGHATKILHYLAAQYSSQKTPTLVPYVFGVCLRSTDELIGHVGLSPYRSQVEIGFAIEEKHQRHGYATEAVSAMTRWGHSTFDIPVILGIVAGANIGSRRVLENSGFTLTKEEAGTLHTWQGLIRTYILDFSVHKET